MHVKDCNNIKSFVVIALLALIFSAGCKKLVQVDLPDGQLEKSVVFSNDSLANTAVIGLHSNIMSQLRYFLNGGISLYAGLSADELNRTSSSIEEDEFLSNSLNTTNSLIGNNIWKAAYSYLYQCNISLEGLQQSTGVSTGAKKRLAAEVKFVRAICYFYLVNSFGDVPLVITSNANNNARLSRSPIDSIYKQIIGDLEDAVADLPDVMENTRPNKMAGLALLARVYLFKENYTEAEKAADLVINSSRYTLVTELSDVFKSVSKETVFQWAPVLSQTNSAEGRIFNPGLSSPIPVYTITNSLLNSFEPFDQRKVKWLKEVQQGGSGPKYTYPNKYKISVSTPATEYNVVLRLSEQYLIRAEARTQQDKLDSAIADINVIRTRAGLPPRPSSLSKSQCLDSIELERRIELFAEWGHRWFDLKRLNKANLLLSGINGKNWQPYDQLYPIPLSEIERAPNLGQNEGY